MPRCGCGFWRSHGTCAPTTFDGDSANGCEAAFATDANNCGACGNKCAAPYSAGDQVTLTAKAGSGSAFSGWTGA